MSPEQAQAINGTLPADPAKRLVTLWKMFQFFSKYREHLDQNSAAQFQTYVAQQEAEYLSKAIQQWKPEMLVRLADEMKKAKHWEPDRIAYALFDTAKQGPVNLSELQREAAERGFVHANRRTWKRHATKHKVPVRDPGAPPK